MPPHHAADVVRLGAKTIGRGNPTFVVFEAGPTTDSLQTARRLAQEAARAGADAIKFQMVNADELVSDRDQEFSYGVLDDTGQEVQVTESLYEILRQRELSRAEWIDLKLYCDSIGILCFFTATAEEHVALAAELRCETVKIASADIDFLPLIRSAARSGLVVQIDTGGASEEEVSTAVQTVLSEGNNRLIVHHCPSGYPARIDSIHLRRISILRQMFACPIGFSDHNPGWDMDVPAVALGADLVEKTITLDRATRGVEHMMSLEPAMFEDFIAAIRTCEAALGPLNGAPSGLISVPPNLLVRRSAFVWEDVAEGQRLRDTTLAFRRPGDGLSPIDAERLAECTFRHAVSAGTKIALSDLIF